MLPEQLVEVVYATSNFIRTNEDEDTWSTWLRRTCKENDFESFRELISGYEALVSSADKRGATPLFYACFYCCEEIVEFLLEKGANVRVKDDDSWTPLKALVQSGMFTSPADTTEKPCLLKLTRTLLEPGADPNTIDCNGQTIWNGHLDILGYISPQTIRLLLEYGLDIHLKSRGHFSQERTLMRYSVQRKNKELIDICLEYGADSNEVDEKGGSLLHTVIRHEPEYDHQKAFDILAFLLERGCNQINYQPPMGSGTALSAVARGLCATSVELLLEHGARIDLDQPLCFLQGVIPWHRPSFLQRTMETVRLLVQHGSVLDMTSPDGVIAFNRLLNPVDGQGKAERDVSDTARDILKLLFQENALGLPEEYGAHVPVFRLMDNWRDYPNVAYGYYLLEFGYKIEIVRDMHETSHGRGNLMCSEQVKSLQSLARINVRKLLGSPLSEKVEDLAISHVMKDFLCLREIDEEVEKWN